MRNPDNYRVAGEAEDLAMLVYDYTAAFPKEERFGLAFHMRKTAVSVGSIFFEACGRLTDKAFVACLGNSHAEASELLFQTRLAVRRKFGDAKLGNRVRAQTEEVRRKLFNLIRSIERDAQHTP